MAGRRKLEVSGGCEMGAHGTGPASSVMVGSKFEKKTRELEKEDEEVR